MARRPPYTFLPGCGSLIVLPPPLTPTIILLLCFLAKWWSSKAKALSLSLYFCVNQFESRNEASNIPPYVLPRPHLLSDAPSSAYVDYQLIVAFSWPNGSHLKPRTLPLSFLMGDNSMPQTSQMTLASVSPTARDLHTLVGEQWRNY